MGNLKIIQVPISDLIPAEYNPRKISPQDRNQLTKSIKKFGLVDPIIVNQHKGRENIIIGGHQRFYIAQKLKYPTIPCVFVDLEIEQEKELNLRLNKNTGEWDYELLQEFDIGLLEDVGFDNIINIENIEYIERKEEIKPYKQIHILISININDYDKFNEDLEKIKTKLEGVGEYEQSAN